VWLDVVFTGPDTVLVHHTETEYDPTGWAKTCQPPISKKVQRAAGLSSRGLPSTIDIPVGIASGPRPPREVQTSSRWLENEILWSQNNCRTAKHISMHA
jgi:hypothetical protein